MGARRWPLGHPVGCSAFAAIFRPCTVRRVHAHSGLGEAGRDGLLRGSGRGHQPPVFGVLGLGPRAQRARGPSGPAGCVGGVFAAAGVDLLAVCLHRRPRLVGGALELYELGREFDIGHGGRLRRR
jgi:hypothetical protein